MMIHQQLLPLLPHIKNTSKNFFERLQRSFHGIPQAKKGAARRLRLSSNFSLSLR